MTLRPKRAPGCGKASGCWVITEFLQRVFWSGPHNTIVCPAGHHIMEGRWLRDPVVVDDYARFWFRGDGFRKQYTWWAAHALHQRSLLLHDSAARGVQAELFGDLEEHYASWLRTHYSERGRCMFTSCHADGEENSAGLDGCRPTINSVMYGEATALGAIAAALGNVSRAAYYAEQAAAWRRVLTEQLWDPELGFFVNVAQPVPRSLHMEIRSYVKANRGREVQTYFGCSRATGHVPARARLAQRAAGDGARADGLDLPWYFGAVPDGDAAQAATCAAAFRELDAPGGFGARWGPPSGATRAQLFQLGAVQLERRQLAVRDVEARHRPDQPLQAYPPQPTVGRRA